MFKISRFLLILILITGWIFSGWPQIWQNPPVPPDIQEARAYATLTYVGGASGTGTGATYSVSLTALTGGIGSAAAAGDLVIVVTGWASAADGNPGVTTPTGYTEVYDLYKSDTRDVNFSVNWKIMGATPDTSVTVSGFNNAANGGATVVHVWRGADQTTPMDVTSPTGATAGNAALPNSPSITPVTAGACVLSVGMGTDDATPLTQTAPTGYGNALSIAGTGSTMSIVANIASKAWTSGAEDPAAWTGGETSTSDSWAAGTLAIRPAPSSPTVTTSATVDSITQTSATLNGNITATGGADATEHGFAYGTSASLSPAIATTTGGAFSGTGAFTSASARNISGLTCNTIYYYRAYATNSGGTGYGTPILNFTTSACNTPPSLTVSTPPLAGASVTVGDTYNITYTLSDAEQTVTAKFFYDLDGFGLDGTAISGCEAKDEGTDLTCSWNTTGVTPDTYYVYATTTDGIAAEVNDYSPGELTVNAAASLTLIVDTDNFPSLTPGTPRFATSTVSVNTNKSTGWYVTLSRDDADTTMDLGTDASVNITDQTAWVPGAATTTVGNAVIRTSLDNSGDVLAFRIMTASGTPSFISTTWWGANDADGTAKWAGHPSTAQKIGISSVSSGGSPALNTVQYYLDVPTTQKTGAYSGTITYTAVMNSP